ncbi:MAG TPA: prepilin-type N-terminal cleavage/methylation domain-containing protein [Clostridia bacterium]|nr:prepilin-type N-terminal cleavage/methylation domain-containing protein [Clostridia bacterium]
MKTLSRFPQGSRRRLDHAGFTITEIMVAMALLSLVIIAVIYSHVFGLRLFNITATKLSACQSARAALNRVRDDIRSGKLLYIGTGDNATFSCVPVNSPREGNALQIYPGVATNFFIRYYVDPSARALKRVASGSTNVEIVAPFITNQMVFRAEDYSGTTLTNDQNNRIIRMTLEFYQWQFPVAQAGVGAYYDYYHLQTRVARRTIE